MNTIYRVEDKYFCNEQELTILQTMLKTVLMPDHNQTTDAGYKITSVYFDDIYDSHLQDTIEGSPIREKYRIRVYNNSFHTIKLEIKFKKYNRIRKKSTNITIPQMKSLLAGECIFDEDSSPESTIPQFNLAISTSHLRPKVIVEYDRAAYIYPEGNVRITLDRNLRASTAIEEFASTTPPQCAPTEIDHVLEIKYDEFLPPFIAKLLETGNMDRTTYSKYRICREAKGGQF